MKVLAIGNSFSADATRYLHQIAKAGGVELKVVNLYIGGCSLERHYNNIVADEKAYEYELNGKQTGKTVSIKEALISDKWDIVTMQQASRLSVNYETYQPYLNYLSEYVMKFAPDAEQVIHQTWAYEQGSELLNSTMGYAEQYDMFNDLKSAYEKASDDLGGCRIIPSGFAFQMAIKRGLNNLYRDTFHAGLGLGRYILSAVWYEKLTGNNVIGNSFSALDEYVPPESLIIAQNCAHDAVKDYI